VVEVICVDGVMRATGLSSPALLGDSHFVEWGSCVDDMEVDVERITSERDEAARNLRVADEQRVELEPPDGWWFEEDSVTDYKTTLSLADAATLSVGDHYVEKYRIPLAAIDALTGNRQSPVTAPLRAERTPQPGTRIVAISYRAEAKRIAPLGEANIRADERRKAELDIAAALRREAKQHPGQVTELLLVDIADSIDVSEYLRIKAATRTEPTP